MSHRATRHLRRFGPTLLTALASMPSPAARDFLLRLLEHESSGVASEVLSALIAYRGASALRDQVEEIVKKRGEEQLKRIVAQAK